MKALHIVLRLAGGCCIAWAVVQFNRLNQPQAAGVWSVPGLLNFWSLVGGLWVCLGADFALFKVRTIAPPAIKTDLSDCQKLTLKAIAEHMQYAGAAGDTASVRSLAQAADVVLSGTK